MKASRPLLAQLAWRFHPRMEEVAVEALAHLLNRYPASRGGLSEVLEHKVPRMRLSDERFQTEVSFADGARPDVLQKGVDGQSRLMVEAKFHASLTPNQPVPYLNWLPDDGISVLAFLAPLGRVEELWLQLLHRLDKKGIPHSDAGPRCAAIDRTGKHLLITDWETVLSGMESRLKDSESGLAELRQLSGLTRFAEANEPKSRHAGEKLVKQVAAIGRNAGWIDTEGLGVASFSYGYGRYVLLGRRARLGVWVGFNTDLHEESRETGLWVQLLKWRDPAGQRWNDRVIPALTDPGDQPVKFEGTAVWVGVVPEHRSDPASYAAALERIAEIVDEAADSPLSPASVLAEVGRTYDQPVMNNIRRSEYVEALLTLALEGSGWTRKEPWEAWHFENESSGRLKVKQSAATQSWGGDRDLGAFARFSIAPAKGYWDDREGRRIPEAGRHANVYVFGWHGGTGETADQRDPASWEFYVIAERDLPEQKSIALTAIRDMTSACDVGRLPAVVDAVLGGAP